MISQLCTEPGEGLNQPRGPVGSLGEVYRTEVGCLGISPVHSWRQESQGLSWPLWVPVGTFGQLLLTWCPQAHFGLLPCLAR